LHFETIVKLNKRLPLPRVKKELRILVVEDGTGDVEWMGELKKSGLKFQSHCVQNREMLLEELERFPPDIILSDYRPPHSGGYKVLQTARDRLPDVPIIYVAESEPKGNGGKVLKNIEVVPKRHLSELVPAVQRALRLAEERAKRKETEEALRKSEERYRSLVDNLRDCSICNLDPNGVVVSWNEASERLEGYKSEEVLGQHFSIFFQDSDRKAKPAAFLKKAAKGEISEELWQRRKDDSNYWSHLLLFPLCDAPGNITGFTRMSHNLSGPRKLQEKVEAMQKEYEERLALLASQYKDAIEELESFSYSVSHDLRAPVRHIDGFTEILQRAAQKELSPDSRGLLQVIGESSRLMGKMIDGLLVFSRLSRMELAPEKTDVTELVRSITRELEMAHPTRNISWSIQKLPVLEADRIPLRQVFSYLLVNAVKFTQPRAVARIEIGAEQTEADQIFFVRDNGVGFNPEYTHKLFGIFQRLHGTSEFEGLGVGLACAKRLMTRLGGRVWAQGSEGEGACFYFSIPRT
jgi:PAS domain S-box-containing protein